MKCPKCGKESSGKFCQHCGAKLDGTSSLNKNQSYNYNPTEQPKKKNKGCLIAVIVVAVILVVFMFLIAIGLSLNNSDKQSSSEPTESAKKEYVESIEPVISNPDAYKGKYVKFYGIISSVDEDEDSYGYQVYTDVDYNNSVLVEVPKDVMSSPIKDSQTFVSIDAEIDGSYDGQTVMGVANTWAYLKAISFEETTYEESFGKANTTWEFSDKIIDQNGMSVSITKVEFASDETRVYITATNNSADSFNLWSSSCKVIQNGTQYEQSFSNYMADYPQISSEILPGASSSGIILFDKLEPSAFQFYIDGSSNNWEIESQPYQFDLVQ